MATPNNTFMSPGVSFYAPAGESAKNWYNFPSLNGQVLLNDSSGTQTLQSIAGNLYYNTELLAKAGDISNVADWADYPALFPVNINGQTISDVSSITVNNTLTADVIQNGALFNTGGISSQGGIVAASLSTDPNPPYALGDVKTTTVHASGLVSAGSVTSSGAITAQGGVDMANTSITRASSVGISNSGFAPYGSLTSPDGLQLTWNGASITTGGAGNVSQWANYAAVTNINANSNNLNSVATATIATGNIGTMSLTSNVIQGGSTSTMGVVAGANQNTVISAPSGGVTINSYNSIDNNAGVNFTAIVDRGINPAASAGIVLNAKNGAGGRIDIIADKAQIQPEPGIINIEANGGSITIDGVTVSVGGLINIDANSGTLTPYSLTSAVKMSAAGINLYAGAIPSVGSLAGYLFQYGTLGVNICAGLPSVFPNIPTTVYIFGLGGVRIEGYAGIQMLSDTYIGNLYPLSGSDLILQGRSLPNGYVKIRDCNEFTMTGGGIAKINTIQATASTTDPVLINNMVSSNIGATNSGNLKITGLNNLIGTDYYVDIDMANTLAFSPSASGAITGVQSINGAAWPPPTGDASLWSQYPATSIIDVSGYGLKNVGDLSGVVNINGVAYPPPSESVGNWATYPAVQSVDLSGNSLTNVSSITTSGILGITAPTKVLVNSPLVDLSGGSIGNVLSILGTSANNVSVISTKNLNLTGLDAVNITGTDGTTMTDPSGITLITSFLDLRGADLIDVKNINGDAGLPITMTSSDNIVLEADNDVFIDAQTGTSTLSGTANVNINSSAGAITLNTTTQVVIPTGQLNMTNNKIINVAPGTTTTDAVNYNQLTFRDSTEFYVSAQGSDISGNGSILAPYQTIQKAITQAELISSVTSICNINVASGNYTENLTFNKGYITLTGTLQSQTGNETCEITGSITIALAGTNDVFNRQVSFSGFNITCGAAQSITNTSTASHTVSFQDCKCFANSVFYVSSSSAPDARLFMTNMEVNQSNAAFTGACITTNVGLVELERLDLNMSGNAIGIAIGGTSVLNRCSLSTLDNSNTAAIIKPLLQINSTTTSTHTLGNVAFAFSSVVAKTNSNALYINSGINTALIMLNNVFTLGGTASSTNNCIGYSGVGSPTIAGVNNTSLNVNVLLPQTTSVQSGISQIQYTNIDPPGLASYSSSVDQGIAVIGTPQALTYNTTLFNQGTTLVANSRIYVSAQGNYQLNYIIQLSNTAGASHTATSFLKKNGATITNTGSAWTIDNAHEMEVSKTNIVSLNIGDYVEVFFSATGGVSANATAATVALPAIPSVVFNLTQIR